MQVQLVEYQNSNSLAGKPAPTGLRDTHRRPSNGYGRWGLKIRRTFPVRRGESPTLRLLFCADGCTKREYQTILGCSMGWGIGNSCPLGGTGGFVIFCGSGGVFGLAKGSRGSGWTTRYGFSFAFTVTGMGLCTGGWRTGRSGGGFTRRTGGTV